MRFYEDMPRLISTVPRVGEALADEMAKLGVCMPSADISRYFNIPRHVVLFVINDVYRANITRCEIKKKSGENGP